MKPTIETRIIFLKNSQILRTILRNRWILIRRSDRVQLMNVAQVRIMRVRRHRALFLELFHVLPIVLLHDRIVTVILLGHVLLLQLVLVMMHGRIAIHDPQLLILAKNVADTERGSGGRQHSNAFLTKYVHTNDVELHFFKIIYDRTDRK